jgi:hypothetical protein
MARTGIRAFLFAESSLQSCRMSTSKLLTVCALCFLLQGCADIQGTKTQPQAVKQPCQRFVPIHREPANVTGVPWSGAFALDTKTGTLCRTYGNRSKVIKWKKDTQGNPVPDTSESKADAVADAILKKHGIISDDWSDMDLCVDLYKQFPD